jgi:hypothetical protein
MIAPFAPYCSACYYDFENVSKKKRSFVLLLGAPLLLLLHTCAGAKQWQGEGVKGNLVV